MKIGVTGAFGYLGSNFIARLLQEGFSKQDIVAFYSKTQSNPVFDSSHVTIRNIEICNLDDVIKKTADIDIICHFAGKVGYRKIDAQSIWVTNVHGTRNVIEAAKINGFKKVVYVSSINVLGASAVKGEIGTEKNDVYNKQVGNPNYIKSPQMAIELINQSLKGDFSFLKKIAIPYFDSKLAAYELVKQYITDSGLPIITVFPGTVVGPGDVHKDISELVENVYQSKLKLTLKGGTSFVDVRDCAEGIFKSMNNGTVGNSYIISGRDADNLTYKGFMLLIAKAAELDSKKVNTHFFQVPHPLAILFSFIAESIYSKSNLTPALSQSGKMIQFFTSRKAFEELGYAPEYELTQSIRDCYSFLHLSPPETVR